MFIDDVAKSAMWGQGTKREGENFDRHLERNLERRGKNWGKNKQWTNLMESLTLDS